MSQEQAKIILERLSEYEDKIEVRADFSINEKDAMSYSDAQVEQMVEAAADSWVESIDSTDAQTDAAALNSPWSSEKPENFDPDEKILDAFESQVDDTLFEQFERNPLTLFDSSDQVEW